MTKVSAAPKLIAALLIMALVCLASATHAAAATANPALVDGSRSATLHVHKNAGDPVTQYGDPTNPDAQRSREPIQGVEFFAQRVDNVDLTTNDGWQQAEALKPTQFFEGGDQREHLGQRYIATTGADGVATFADLPLGLYLVTENHATAQRQNLSLVAPFLIALPATNETGDAWNYDVTVQAKDQLITATKQANRTCVAQGQTIEYGVSTTLPAPDADGNITSLSISDPLEAAQRYVEGSTEVLVGASESSLQADDYTVSVQDNTVTLTLTDKGLATLAPKRLGKPDLQLTWKFIVDVVATQDKIRNKAYVTPPGYPAFDRERLTGVPSNQTTVRMPCKEPQDPKPIPIPVPDPNNPSTTPPKQPGTPTAPGTPISQQTPPGQSTPGTTPPKANQRTGLSNTGASVFGILGLAVLLIAFGLFLLSRRNEREA
ncbi:SpaH/EbpB family LPXTG-anchored major pilin [Corynebacterium lizhenjunii]|uniref:SpaH/EbpB family LPXTG-anchored major pilin n=1 Tax=Corynebacterium lizhenjunii TaxID=2709394 RepID=A0A7T0PA54_9CORY|nr:SpaH/EbpB family LPXTG-anchored major pilin [Corynebacterium lizhenjunii]QPK79513.1 SpaH/EbpB family LPXTG-anchored major pilin [Corynebacterium lizhenjunii]